MQTKRKRKKSKKWKGWKKVEAQALEEEFTATEALAGRKLANMYLMRLKSMSVYALPWKTSQPIEHQAVFACFIKAHRLIEAEGHDWREYMRAQFEAWNGPPNTYPFPQQLYTDSAIQRFARWKFEQEEEKEYFEAQPKVNGQRFKYDRLKLKRLKLAHHKPGRRILLMFPTEFSKDFLVKRGVWDEVKSTWYAARELDR